MNVYPTAGFSLHPQDGALRQFGPNNNLQVKILIYNGCYYIKGKTKPHQKEAFLPAYLLFYSYKISCLGRPLQSSIHIANFLWQKPHIIYNHPN